MEKCKGDSMLFLHCSACLLTRFNIKVLVYSAWYFCQIFLASDLLSHFDLSYAQLAWTTELYEVYG